MKSLQTFPVSLLKLSYFLSLVLFFIGFVDVLFTYTGLGVWSSSLSPWQQVLSGFGLQWSAVIFAFLLCFYRDLSVLWRLLTQEFWNFSKMIWAPLYFLVFMAFYFVLFYIQSLWSLPGFEAQDPLLASWDLSTMVLASLFVVIVIIGPFLEEFFFRFMFLESFALKWGRVVAVLLSAILFSLVHFEWKTFFPIFILGLILGFACSRHRSLSLAFALHALNNALQVFFVAL